MCSICQLDFIVKVLFRFLEQLEKRSRESVVENENALPPIAYTKKYTHLRLLLFNKPSPW